MLPPLLPPLSMESGHPRAATDGEGDLADGGVAAMDVDVSLRKCCTGVAPEALLQDRVRGTGKEALCFGPMAQPLGDDAPLVMKPQTLLGCEDDGDIDDDDSSDGGAAHEDISLWLHSTQDWWTS